VPRLPDPVARFAEQAAGPGATVADRSWARANSNVWELTTPSGARFFLKVHPGVLFHRREVNAYRNWTARLGAGRAPVLLRADADMLAIVVSALPGYLACDPKVPAAAQPEIHRQAGELLRRFHEAAPPSAGTAGTDRVAARVEEHLARAAGLLDSTQVSLVREHAARLPLLARNLPVVPTHGDAQPRNFLWDPAAGRLSLIDFERAEPAPAVRDLVRLAYGPWDGHPALREAFFDGYGRPLAADADAALRSYAALDALSGIQWGSAHGDTETVTRGYRTLAALAAQG
jgi:aminoglycoside phosphotransferase (APT) family kinase protein